MTYLNYLASIDQFLNTLLSACIKYFSVTSNGLGLNHIQRKAFVLPSSVRVSPLVAAELSPFFSICALGGVAGLIADNSLVSRRDYASRHDDG